MKDKIYKILIKYKSSNDVIYPGYFEDIVRDILGEIEFSNAELRAKIYAYEKIIANSNFKAILKGGKNESN